MATLQQTDTSSGGDGGTVQCSGGAISHAGTAFRIATSGGTPGTGTPSATTEGTAKAPALQATIMFESAAGEPGITSWAAGNWVVRLNVTSGNASLQWDATYVCRTDSTNTVQATVGSLTGQGTSLTSTGVKTHTISGSAQTANAGDKIYIVLVLKTSAGAATSINFKPNQLIDWPGAAVVTVDGVPLGLQVARVRRPFLTHGPAVLTSTPIGVPARPPLLASRRDESPLVKLWEPPILLKGAAPQNPVFATPLLLAVPPPNLAHTKSVVPLVLQGPAPPALTATDQVITVLTTQTSMEMWARPLLLPWVKPVILKGPAPNNPFFSTPVLYIHPWDDKSFNVRPVRVIVPRGVVPTPNHRYFVVSHRKNNVLTHYYVAYNNLQATTDPSAFDDASGGYAPGSLWVNTSAGKVWCCTSATVAAASWVQLG